MSSPHPDLGWVPSVFSEWPGPIAHEYHRLADLLSQSHAATNQPNYRILGAFLEMRDFAEVLIKLPTIVMIRDGDRLRLDMREIKGLLLGTPPSLGGWLEAARRAAKTLRVSADTIWTRDLVAIFLDDKGKPSSFAHLLEKVVQWRNSELGHGALRMDLDGLTNELQELVKEMNSRLATVAMRKPWNNLQIQLDGSRTPLVGFECIRRQHEGDPESGHTDREMALMCECSGKENILNLAPYAAARTCTKCNKRDVFFFNGLSGRAPNRKAQYLDYMMGHSLLPVLGNDRRWTDESADLGGLRARGAIGAKRIDENLLALLERIDLSRDYVAPTYMAEELQEFLASHDRGIVWLRAPAHTGKTVFAGHAKSLLADDPGDLMISTFFIKREYRFGLGMFNAFIDDAFYRGMPSQYHRR